MLVMRVIENNKIKYLNCYAEVVDNIDEACKFRYRKVAVKVRKAFMFYRLHGKPIEIVDIYDNSKWIIKLVKGKEYRYLNSHLSLVNKELAVRFNSKTIGKKVKQVAKELYKDYKVFLRREL